MSQATTFLVLLFVIPASAAASGLLQARPHNVSVIVVDVIFDGAFATRYGNPEARLLGILSRVNEFLAPASVRLTLGNVTPGAAAYPSLCEGPESLLGTLRASGAPPGRLLLGVSGAFVDMPVLGCAYQHGYGSERAVAAVQDPPYEFLVWGAQPDIREHHAQVLYAHELGHLLGGLHEYAWPQGDVSGATGTIMYPTLQYNTPAYSGALRDGRCVVDGNLCLIHVHITGQRDRLLPPILAGEPHVDQMRHLAR